MDKTTLLVLESLQSLVGTSDDIMDRWFYPIVLSRTLGMDIDAICDEYDILRGENLIESRQSPDRTRIGTLARVSDRGAALLAESRKQKRVLDSAAAVAEAPSDRIIVRERRLDRPYDVFISYASQDRAYALSLRDALVKADLSVWMDVDELLLGDAILRKMDEGIKQSRYAVLLISRAYIQKSYTKAEFEAVLKRTIEARGSAILPILHGGLTQAELAEFNSFVSGLRNLSTDKTALAEVANEVLRVVAPPSVSVVTPPEASATLSSDRANAALVEPGRPHDALDDDARLFTFRPRLNFGDIGFVQQDPNNVEMRYAILNVGAGTASKIRAFLPGLWVDEPSAPLEPNHRLARTIILSEREAYFSILPIYAQVVVEFEDHVGNLYRQYGSIDQQLTPHGYYYYIMSELNRPYLVPQRIVREDPQHVEFLRKREGP
jgi:hypothetical protein